MDVHMYTVGAIQENTFLLNQTGSTAAVIVDPGAEGERLAKEIADKGLTLEAILITHTHFDHIGAVADLHDATGAEVWCPAGEVETLRERDGIPLRIERRDLGLNAR